jgi:hypothetical protein
MQTMYYNTSNFIEHSGNVIDLDELRRRQTAAQRDSLARQPEAAYIPEETGFRPVVLTMSRSQRRRAWRERRAWTLDAYASVAVILMTAAFLVRMAL